MAGPPFNRHISADSLSNNLEFRMELPVDIIINSAKSQVSRLETESYSGKCLGVKAFWDTLNEPKCSKKYVYFGLFGALRRCSKIRLDLSWSTAILSPISMCSECNYCYIYVGDYSLPLDHFVLVRSDILTPEVAMGIP